MSHNWQCLQYLTFRVTGRCVTSEVDYPFRAGTLLKRVWDEGFLKLGLTHVRLRFPDVGYNVCLLSTIHHSPQGLMSVGSHRVEGVGEPFVTRGRVEVSRRVRLRGRHLWEVRRWMGLDLSGRSGSYLGWRNRSVKDYWGRVVTREWCINCGKILYLKKRGKLT